MLYGKTNESYLYNIKVQTTLVQEAMVQVYVKNQPKSLAGTKKNCLQEDAVGKKSLHRQ